MKELPLVEDYGEGFRSRIVEWGGMIVSYETFPKGVDEGLKRVLLVFR